MLGGRGSGTAVGCVVAWLLAAACGSNALDVRVTALRDPARTGRTYWLVPAEGHGATQLEFRAVESLVHKALRARGYQQVGRDIEPHLVVLLGYGVGPPQAVVQATQGGARWQPGQPGRSGIITGVGSTATGPRMTWSGWTRVEVFTVYTTWVRLSAVDGKAFAAGRPAGEVWSTTARTEARGSDLQVLLPVLLASAMDYFAANVRRDVRLLVPPDSQRVEWLARSAP
jgi:hypothetical protein